MEKKTKVCFVGDLSSSFVRNDYKILKKHFEVKSNNHKHGFLKFLLGLFEIAKNILRSDVSFSWFAGWHSAFAVFFSKLFRKKSIVVVGGHDAAYVPEIKYGAFTNIKESLPAKYVYKNVDKVVVVDLSLKSEIIKNAKVSGNNIKCIPTGYNPNYWKPKGEKKNFVLTVAGADNLKRVKVKGLDTLVQSARYLSDIKFIVIGVEGEAKEYLERDSPENVELIEFLPYTMLLSYYQSAKVYCQLSLREGLPNTLCEAMLCECIPVGTNVQGVKSAMGNVGFSVPYGDAKASAEAIQKALDTSEELGKKARERIKKMFPIGKREEELVELITSLVRR